MKPTFVLLTTLLITGTAHATTSEQFFTAYQVAQVSGLSKVLANQAHNPQVFAETVAKLQQQNTPLLTDKSDAQQAPSEKTTPTDKPKDTYQKQVIAYLNSSQASNYFDSLATEILANSYSYEQLKALYQLYTNPSVQNFLPKEISFEEQQSAQNYLITSKFQQQLEAKTKQILDNVALDDTVEVPSNEEIKAEPKVAVVTIEQTTQKKVQTASEEKAKFTDTIAPQNSSSDMVQKEATKKKE